MSDSLLRLKLWQLDEHFGSIAVLHGSTSISLVGVAPALAASSYP